jgi:hypothetical protein
VLGEALGLVDGEAEVEALDDGDSASVNVPVRTAGYGPAPCAELRRTVQTSPTISTRTFILKGPVVSS